MTAINSCQVVANLSVVEEGMTETGVEAKGERVSFVDVVAEKKITHVGESDWTRRCFG